MMFILTIAATVLIVQWAHHRQKNVFFWAIIAPLVWVVALPIILEIESKRKWDAPVPRSQHSKVVEVSDKESMKISSEDF